MVWLYADRIDGKYNRAYTYAYDEGQPNVAFSLLFMNSADATDFGNTVLKLSSPPTLTWSTGPNNRFVSNISDAEPNAGKYKAILLTHTRLEWKYSELFYMYRDTDYIYHRTFSLYKAEPTHSPHFSRCDKHVGNVSIELDEESISFALLSSLTPGHKLIFSRHAHYVAIKGPRKFGSAKSSKG
ncbi:MAG: hypothetical protein Q9179_000595 [Wetmoreana sp. 5 TL-2023]